MASASGHWRKGRFVRYGEVDYRSMTPKQLVKHAMSFTVTNVGQFSKQQQAALNRAVRAGKLERAPDGFWSRFSGSANANRLYRAPQR